MTHANVLGAVVGAGCILWTIKGVLVGDAPVLSIIRDLVVITAALVGIYVGLSGLNTWKRQLTGASRHQLGRRVVRSLRDLKAAVENGRFYFDYVDQIRSGGPTQGILKSRTPVDPDKIETEAIDRFYKAQADLRADSDEASDLFGVEAERLLQEVLRLPRGFWTSCAARRYRASELSPEERTKTVTVTNFSDHHNKDLDAAIAAALEFFRKQL